MIEPFYQDEAGQITIYCGDARDVLPSLADLSVDFTITDPPFGFRKAGWDDEFPTFWLDDAARVSRQAIAIMPGINNLLSLPRCIGAHEYRWTLSVHLSNGMTRGLMGFGNWIPVLVYGRDGVSLYQPQQDAVAVPVIGDMPKHPSPKPLRAMTWIVSRFAQGTILDPFAGSGTTLVAAKQLGRPAIGIEKERAYCALIVDRLAQSVLPWELPA